MTWALLLVAADGALSNTCPEYARPVSVESHSQHDIHHLDDIPDSKSPQNLDTAAWDELPTRNIDLECTDPFHEDWPYWDRSFADAPQTSAVLLSSESTESKMSNIYEVAEVSNMYQAGEGDRALVFNLYDSRESTSPQALTWPCGLHIHVSAADSDQERDVPPSLSCDLEVDMGDIPTRSTVQELRPRLADEILFELVNCDHW